MKKAWVIGTVALGVGGLAATAAFLSAAESEFAYRDPAVVAEGRALYQANCASCHGAALEGEENWRQPDTEGYLPAPPHDETGHTWHHPTEVLFTITKLGTEAVVGGDYRSRMPGFGDQLDDHEIRAILAFIKSTWPDRVIARHDQMNAAAR